jgi:hypothetical protein
MAYTGGTTRSQFDPSRLQPMDEPRVIEYNIGSADNPESNMRYEIRSWVGPDGRTYQSTSLNGSQPMYMTADAQGNKIKFQRNPDGSWQEGTWQDKGGFAETVFGDNKLMTFGAIAGAGALAGSAIGAGGAGGSMLGGGTGAPPGIVAGGTMGQAGLGAATGTGLLGTMGGGNPAADELFDSERIGGPMGPGGAPGGTDFMSQLRNWLGGGEGFNLGGIGDIAKTGGQLALIGRMYDEQKGNAQEWRDFMGKATPDLGTYQGLLKDSYTNPGGYLNSPDFLASQNIVHNKLQRSDAAGGRLANDFGRQVGLQDHALDKLNDYRQNLGGLVNQQQNTSSGQGSNALSNAQNQESEWMRNLMNMISGMGK